ncbi:MAG: hypothetical protein AAB975_04285 [Patescibacteria group bacterium]
MTRLTRRIFFYSSVAIFVLLAPILVAYSIGYTFRSDTRSLEKTGGIFIKSKTPRISIFLDGTFIKETSYFSGGALLTEIVPGIHRLRLEKANYHPWSSTIHVEPELVTDLRNILLISNSVSIATSTPNELISLGAQAANEISSPIIPKETISIQDLSEPVPSPAFSLDNDGNLIGKTATTSKILASHINSFSIFEQTVYFINKNGFLGKLDPVSEKITTIGRPGFYLLDQPARFFQAPDESIVILDASGGLFLSDGSTHIQTITGGVRQFAFDSSGIKMLIQKNQSIDIFWLKDNAFQPFEKNGTRQQVFASDTAIHDADWFFADNAHIVIRTTDGIFFTDIDVRYGKNIVQLFSKKTDELVTIPSLPNAIFFRREKVFYTISI